MYHPVKYILFTILLLITSFYALPAQTINDFTSVNPLIHDQLFHIPPTHRFQVLVQTADSGWAGNPFRGNPDFCGFVPPNNGMTQPRLAINHELNPGGVSVGELNWIPQTGLWSIQNKAQVDFSMFGPAGTGNNCSGGITPWGTMVSAEENVAVGDGNGDGYLDYGWLVEVDPVTASVVSYPGLGQAKLWEMGRMKHENAAFHADRKTVYFGEDQAGSGYLFKFIATDPEILSHGDLYVLDTAASPNQWKQVPNKTQYAQNNTILLADSIGGTKWDRIEDVEIGPDERIYFTSTTQGRVFSFRDEGVTISRYRIFVESQKFAINHTSGQDSAEFTWCDNLAFDCAGNLWTLQDGGDHLIWVVGPSHTSATPDIRVFGTIPAGAEPTGITFTPDCDFLFMSIQHPDGNNADTMPDVTGRMIRFNQSAVMAIGRQEVLGQGVSVEEYALNDLEVYPNPSNDLLTIRMQTAIHETVHISLFDLAGKELIHFSYVADAIESLISVSIANLPAGVFILRGQSSTGSFSQKIIHAKP